MQPLFSYPHQYVEFLAYYHGSRDYFECHEIMEEYWKERKDDRHEICWLVLIRLSVACYHARRNNWTGALKMLSKAAGEIEPTLMNEIGLDGDALLQSVLERQKSWAGTGRPVYEDLDLPINDANLEEAARSFAAEQGWRWGMAGVDAPNDILHRHTRRDRSAVVEARLQSERSKKNKLL
jgi:predicted metal-dependent hydrolase